MDNINEQENQGHPDSGFRSLENKVSTLEQQIAEQQDQLRDYEKSLVERIADVDDDRRSTTSQLHRAWRSQLEEFNSRLGRQMVFVFGALFLFLVVVGIVFFLAYHQENVERQLLADELAGLKMELGRISGKQADAESVEEALTRLSAAVNEITSSGSRRDKEQTDSLDAILQDERIARDQADAVIGAEIQRLEARLESLKQELDTIGEAMEPKGATKAASRHRLPEGSSAEGAKQDSDQELAATTVEPPDEFSSVPRTERVNSPEEIPAPVAEQPFGAELQEKVTDASTDVETPKTLVVANDNYGLQLIGFYNLDMLLSFANRNDLPQRLYYREETAQGRPWFALIHSLHEDYASAEAQLQNLSPELVAMVPWIRPISAGVKLTVLDMGSQRQP